MPGGNVFLSLVVGHLIADFPLQTDTVYRLRQRGWWGIALHAGIHAVVAVALVHGLIRRWWLLLGLGLVHAAIDSLKPRLRFSKPGVTFLVDQGLHLASVGAVAWFARDLQSTLSGPLLYAVLAVATFPALLMFLSILEIEERPRLGRLSIWAGEGELLALYQVTGWLPFILLLLWQLRFGF